MRRISRAVFCFLILVALLYPAYITAQQFDTGEIGIILSQYGRIRLYAPSLTGNRQIDRTSILVGVSDTAVFDYYNDADAADLPTNILNPTLSDFEIYGSINNDWSNDPPEVLVKINIYGWSGGGYCVAKFTIISEEAASIDAITGLEIIPQIDGVYGYEIVEWLTAEETVSTYKDTSYVGYKWFSSNLISSKSFDWFNGYNYNDPDLWDYLNYGQFDLYLQSGLDGAVIVPAQDFVTVEPGDSTIIYFGIAYGTSESAMIDNINSAEEAYITMTGTPNVTITLTPYNPPITIPSSGGSFDFNVALANNETTPQTFDAWIMVTLPNGAPFGPVLGPVNLTLPGGYTLDRDRVQEIPASAPTGTYTYTASVGYYPATIWMEDSFTFEKLATGDGAFIGEWTNTGESFELTTANPAVEIPTEFALNGAYPNPFNPETRIAYALPEVARVSLAVYDVAGRRVITLVDGWRDVGLHEVIFDGSGLPSGIYIYQLETTGYITSGKMVLLK